MKGKIEKHIWHTPIQRRERTEYWIEYICKGRTSCMVIFEEDMEKFMSDINKDWDKIIKRENLK